MRILATIAIAAVTAISAPAQAAANIIGTGCTGSNGAPTMTASQAPVLGQPITLDLVNLPVAPGFVWLMWSTDSDMWAGMTLPLDLGFLGAPGCMLYVRPDHNDFYLQPSSGMLSLTYEVPQSFTFLIGCRVLVQSMVCDDGVNALGYTSTNAVEFFFGV